MKKLMVRGVDKFVFEIDRNSLEPKQCSYYDAYCFSDPSPDVEYMEYGDWLEKITQGRLG